MALNFNNFETVLQTKLDTITDEKDMLLLGKAIEATVGNVTVSEIQAEAAIQKSAVTAEGGTQISAVQAQGTSERSQINAMSSGFATTASLSPVATSGSAADLSNLRTVGGQSIAGVGGDIATLPAGGSVGQVIKKDASNNPAWAADEGGKVLQVVQTVQRSLQTTTTSFNNVFPNLTVTPTKTGSKFLCVVSLNGVTSQDDTGTIRIDMIQDSVVAETLSFHFGYKAGGGDPLRLSFNANWFSGVNTAGVAKIFNVYFKNNNTGGIVRVNNDNSDHSTLTVWEIL